VVLSRSDLETKLSMPQIVDSSHRNLWNYYGLWIKTHPEMCKTFALRNKTSSYLEKP
jgi:hypothetical protein